MNIWELLVVLVVSVVIAILVALVVVIFRLIWRNRRENIRLRLEVGKLADELEQSRKQEGTEGGESADKLNYR